MNTDPNQTNYKNDIQPYLERLHKIEQDRRSYCERTPATLADIEDAVNYVLRELRIIADYMDINDFTFDIK